MSNVTSDEILQYLQQNNFDPNAIAQGMQQYGVGLGQIQQAGGWNDPQIFDFIDNSGNDYLLEQFGLWRPDWNPQAQVPAADPWSGIRQLKFSQYDYEVPSVDIGDSARSEAYTQRLWGVDQDALNAGGYNTKYFGVPEEVEPGLFKITVQQPGMHKYDTADAYYRVDPETGMGTLVDDPTATRQVSSREKWRDNLEGEILPIIGTVLAAGAAGGAFAGAGAGTTAAETAAAAAAAGGATAGEITQAALVAGLKGAGYSAAVNSLQQLAANGFDLDEIDVNAVLKSAEYGFVGGTVASGIAGVNPAGAAGIAPGTLQNAVNSGIAGGVTAAATGSDSDEILRSIIAGGAGGAGVFNVTDIPAINKALSAGVRAEIMGKDGWEAALASGLNSATSFIAKEYDIPSQVVSAAVSAARGDPAKAIESLVRYGVDTAKKPVEEYFKAAETEAAQDPYDGLQLASSDGSSPLTGEDTRDAYGFLPAQKTEIAQYLSSFPAGTNKDIVVDDEGAYSVYDPDNGVFYKFSSDGAIISTGVLYAPEDGGSTSPEARSFIDVIRATTGELPVGTGGGTGSDPGGELLGGGKATSAELDEQDIVYRALFSMGLDPTDYGGSIEALIGELSGNYTAPEYTFSGPALISESDDGQRLYRDEDGGYTVIAKANAQDEAPLWVELALDKAGQITDSKPTTAPVPSGSSGGGSGAPGGGATLDEGEDAAGGELGGGDVGGDTGASGAVSEGGAPLDEGEAAAGENTGTDTSGAGSSVTADDGTGGAAGSGTGLGGTGPDSSGGPGSGPGTGTDSAGPGEGGGLPGDGLGTIPGSGTGAVGEGTGGPGTGPGPGGTGGPGAGTGTGPAAGPGDGTGAPGPGPGGGEPPPDLPPYDYQPPDIPPVDIPPVDIQPPPVKVTPRITISNPSQPGPGGLTWPQAQQQATAAGVPYLANVFYFQALDPGDTQAASVTDFQGQRKRLAKVAEDRKKRLYAEQEVEENAAKPETKIADMLRLIMQDDGDTDDFLRRIVGG